MCPNYLVFTTDTILSTPTSFKLILINVTSQGGRKDYKEDIKKQFQVVHVRLHNLSFYH